MSALYNPRRRPANTGHRLCCMVILFLMWFSLSAAGQEADTVSIGIVSDNQPYTAIHGREAVGFSVDVLNEVARHTGLTFKYRAGAWPDIYAAFLAGELDAIDGVSYSEERAREILFTAPYHVRQTYLMHDPERPVGEVRSLDDLKSLKVGVVKDIYYRDLLIDHGITPNTYDSLPSLIRALAFGWVDVIIGPELTLQYYATLAGFRFLEVIGPAPLGTLSQEDFRLGVLKSNRPLFEQLRAGLRAVPEERINELHERWQEFGGSRIDQPEAFSLSIIDQQYIRELGPVRIGIMRDYAPFSFKDGARLQGLTVDILNRVRDITRLQVIPVSGQWSELLEMFRHGDIDIMMDMSINEERQAFTRFSEPYHVIPNVAFTLNRDLQFQSIEDMEDLTVAFGEDIYYEEALRARLGDSAQSFNSQRSMFEALADGTVDVVLAALPNGNHWVRELGITGTRIAGELMLDDMTGEDLRFGVRPSMAPLVDIINQALMAISATEKKTIEDRWLGAAFHSPDESSGSLTLSEEEQQWLDQRDRQLTLCADPDWLPLEAIDSEGRHVGLSAELFRLFADRTGIRFDVFPAPDWPSAVDAARDRHCDLFSLAMKTPERSRFMSFTEPYLHVPNVVIGRIEAPFFERMGELRNKRLGIVGDYAFAELLRQRHPGIQLTDVSSEHEGLRLVQQGDLDGYVTTLATASHYMKELGLVDLKVIGRIPADWSLSVATRSDEPVLLNIMEKLVASLTDEERKQLDNQWRTMQLEQTVDYSLLWQLMLIATCILALLFYWNRKLGRLNKELAVANATLAHLSVTDDLTKLGNRAYFDREFSQSFQWCQRHGAGFAVAMVDADHFKRINDGFGHEAGDVCLTSLADLMRGHFRRDTDRIARFGGEEFVVFTTYTDENDLIDRLDSFREAVAAKGCRITDRDIHLTISIGLAVGVPGSTAQPAEFLRLADQALYLAKQNGRNRLEVNRVETSEHR